MALAIADPVACGRPEDVPLALARRHRALPVGAALDGLVLVDAAHDGWTEARLRDVAVGAGFNGVDVRAAARQGGHRVVATRARTLADTVGADLRVLLCGLNPSLYAADAGIGFARPGNRFWPAALAAGLVTRDRDPDHALSEHGVGMTDLVKRATVRADELTTAEYAEGVARVERLVGWLRPAVVCFVGLDGWRRAVDRRAVPGRQERDLAGAVVHLVPSTSGLNAHATLGLLVEHFRVVAAAAGVS